MTKFSYVLKIQHVANQYILQVYGLPAKSFASVFIGKDYIMQKRVYFHISLEMHKTLCAFSWDDLVSLNIL